jgi:2-oxoglutarate ferredoxin oxidoreductase subunit alpha
VLAPYTVQEAYDCLPLAFSLADKYRNPVIVLGDGMLGQMMEPIQRSEVRGQKSEKRKSLLSDTCYLSSEKKWALTGCKGRKANVIKSFYMAEGTLEKFNLLLQKKYEAIKKNEELYEEYFTTDAQIILVAYGSMARIAKGALNQLRAKGKRVGLIRPVTLWPFPNKVFKRLTSHIPHPTFLVIEMSYGQLLEDVKLAVNGKLPVEFLGRAGGGIPTEEQIIKRIAKLLNC